jgi:hypothetical protein
LPKWQSAILAPPTAAGRFITLGLTRDAKPRDVVARLGALTVGADLIVGLGAPLVGALGATIAGLRLPRAAQRGRRVPVDAGRGVALRG